MNHYWDYRLIKLINRDDEINTNPLYLIAEVFFEDDKPHSYTESDNVQDSIIDIKWMIKEYNDILDKGILTFDEKENRFV